MNENINLSNSSNLNNLSNLISKFLIHLRKISRAENTISSYHSDLKIFKTFLNQFAIPYTKVSPETLEHFKQYLKNESLEGPNTIRRMIISVRRFYAFLTDTNHIKHNHVNYFKVPTRIDHLPEVPSSDEFDCFFDIIKGDSLKSKRDRALILTLGYLGLRVGELCKLTWNDLYLEANTAYLHIPGKNSRTIPISEPLFSILSTYQKSIVEIEKYPSIFISFRGNREEEIMPTISRHGVKHLIYHNARLASLSGITPQSFRHYAAIRWIKSGLDENKIAEYLGFSNLNSLEKYYQLLQQL